PGVAPAVKREPLGRRPPPRRMTAKRHGWAAGLFGLLTPGLGHLYAGRVRGAIVLGILVTPFAAFLFLLDVLAAPPPALFFLFGVAILLTVVVGIPIHAALLARRTGSAYQLRTFNRSYVYIAFFVLVGLVWQRGSHLFSTAYVAEAFRIPSAAGEPTLLVGDYIYVVKIP